METTALIILNYNNAKATLNCLESVLKFNSAPVKFVVIDNGSRPDELAALRSVMKGVFNDFLELNSGTSVNDELPLATLLISDKNLGYARGNNLGLELAYADPQVKYIMILNNDILFISDMIPTLISEYEELGDVAILSPVLYKRDGESIDHNCARRPLKVREMIAHNFLHYWWIFRNKKIEDVYPNRFLLLDKESQTQNPLPIYLPSGSCMLCDKELFKSIGSFDSYTFLFQEENILYEKIRPTGRRNYVTTSVGCIHLGGETMDEVPNQVWLLKVSQRSEDYFIMKYSGAPWWQKGLYKISKWFFLGTFALQKAAKKMLNR